METFWEIAYWLFILAGSGCLGYTIGSTIFESNNERRKQYRDVVSRLSVLDVKVDSIRYRVEDLERQLSAPEADFDPAYFGGVGGVRDVIDVDVKGEGDAPVA